MIDAWEWPQWFAIGLYALGLLMHAAFNGQPIKDAKWNFPLKVWVVGASAFILYMGGFFS